MNWLLHHHVSPAHPARVVRGALIDDARVQTTNAAPINPATQHRPKQATSTDQYLARRPAAAAAPPPPLVDKMMYWNRYIAKMGPADKSWLPAVRPDKYLLASVDPGGFNNIRLSFEVQVVLALLTGRTLVLPQQKKWYLLGDQQHSFQDFFDISALKQLVPCVSWEEYSADQFKSRSSKRVVELDPVRQAVAWPSMQRVKQLVNPLEVANAVSDRTLVDLDNLWEADVLSVTEQHRLLGTWHTFVIFDTAEHDKGLKRLMRDFVHYTEAMMQLAAHSVGQLGGIGSYTALHIRRGDFQYSEVKLAAERTFSNIEPLLKRSGKKKIYISTDESNRNFFHPFVSAGYELAFWDDVKPKEEVPYHLVGMVEQLICVESNLFVGTRLSTFTSYIQRLRGYSPALENKEVFYGDRVYTGKPATDGNEKLINTHNQRMGGGELATFREPANVWVLEDAESIA